MLETPDLGAAARAARAAGLGVALVRQPWHVAGRRVAEHPRRLDQAWTHVVRQLSVGRPLLVGGRSSGARVACRTADESGALAVLCLAFPLRPPGGGPSRFVELAGPRAPVLVVQGERDAFGRPPAAPGRDVVVVPGADHGFAVRRRDGRSAEQVRHDVEAAVTGWLTGPLAQRLT